MKYLLFPPQLWSLGCESRKNSASSDDENNNERKSSSLLQKGRQLVEWQQSGGSGNNGHQTSEKPLSTMTGHSGPVTGVKLSLPFALSAAGCAVRLWDVTQVAI